MSKSTIDPRLEVGAAAIELFLRQGELGELDPGARQELRDKRREVAEASQALNAAIRTALGLPAGSTAPATEE